MGRAREIEARYGLGAIRMMISEGVAEGSIVEVDADAMAHLLLSMVDEAALFIADADDPIAARGTHARRSPRHRGARGSLSSPVHMQVVGEHAMVDPKTGWPAGGPMDAKQAVRGSAI